MARNALIINNNKKLYKGKRDKKKRAEWVFILKYSENIDEKITVMK